MAMVEEWVTDKLINEEGESDSCPKCYRVVEVRIRGTKV